MKSKIKRILPDVLCIVLFIAIAAGYFYPAVFDGKRLEGHDHTGGMGLGTEINQYRETHDGEDTRWTNVAFGGMPTYQIAPSYKSTSLLNTITKVYHLGLPDYIFYIFISMLGFYILLRAFDFRQWMAALGAVIWAFSSYFFIIIAAGHIWKVLTLAYIPPTIAGIVLCYRGKYLWGGVLTAIFAAFQILSNHVQMSYYFLFAILMIVIGFLVDAIKNGTIKRFLAATAVVAVAAVLAIGVNLSNLYHTYEYSKETMRGKSELVKEGKQDDQTDSGLERSYITNWSYGIGETFSLLVPNINGGASVPLSESKTAMEKADPDYNNVYGAFTQYWGEQPGTSGPVYVGAFVCMLFVLSFFLVKNSNPLKWPLVAATVLSILLAWGKNFMPFTDFFIDNVPMYSKFRTVSSALVVAEFTIPLLAMMALKEFMDKARTENARMLLFKPLVLSTAITAGLALLFALFPSMFFGECISSNDQNMMNQYVAQGYIPEYEAGNILVSVSECRRAMLTSDAFRSAAYIMIGFVLMLVYLNKKDKFKPVVLVVMLLVLCLADMWTVNKRYLNDSMFVFPSITAGNVQPREVDTYIKEADAEVKDYRVLDLSLNTFNDNFPSNFHFSIGGYHPAKLRRYQELIEAHIQPEFANIYQVIQKVQADSVLLMQYLKSGDQAGLLGVVDNEELDSLMPVVNMLNTRWFILPGGKDGNSVLPLKNPAACGNAWFVDRLEYVDNANQEIDALGKLNPRSVAIVDKSFMDKLVSPESLKADSAATVTLDEYTPNHLTYSVNSKNGGVVVFSEIYYPDWTATIDGKAADIARADYVLRAMYVPKGSHKIEMTFDPQSVHSTETVAYASLSVMLIGAAVAIALAAFRRRKAEKEETAEEK